MWTGAAFCIAGSRRCGAHLLRPAVPLPRGCGAQICIAHSTELYLSDVLAWFMVPRWDEGPRSTERCSAKPRRIWLILQQRGACLVCVDRCGVLYCRFSAVRCPPSPSCGTPSEGVRGTDLHRSLHRTLPKRRVSMVHGPQMGRRAAKHRAMFSKVSTNLVDPASSHMLRSRAKPCMSQSKRNNSGSVNGSLHQQSSEQQSVWLALLSQAKCPVGHPRKPCG